MVDLKKWAFGHRIYLKLESNKPVTCKLVDYEAFVDEEQESRDKIRYHLEVDGNRKILESQSTQLAEEMAKVKKGEWIKLTRSGKGRQTSYEVEVLPTPEEDISESDLEEADSKIKK